MLTEDDAPDPLDYDDREEYLRECWEFALHDLPAAIDSVGDTTDRVRVGDGFDPAAFDAGLSDTDGRARRRDYEPGSRGG